MKIEGALQEEIEKYARGYIGSLIKSDMYYDPKELDPYDIVKNYYTAVDWAVKNNRTDLMKTDWGKLNKYEKKRIVAHK
ncbi:MAG: hypothetical protein WC716_16590 [Chitinophagaceae bacterium]|jgi:hypothetical protein